MTEFRWLFFSLPSEKIRNAATFLRRTQLLWPVWLRQKRNSKRNGITNETWRIVFGVFRLVDFLSATHNPLKGIGYGEMLRRGGSFERVVGKLRSVDGAKNVTRLIMVQRIFSQPMVVLKVVFELKMPLSPLLPPSEWPVSKNAARFFRKFHF